MNGQLLVAYTILGFTMIFVMMIFILRISGKDMIFAIYRFFNAKGNDVFIVGSNRNMTRYFKEPKDGMFKIENNIYVTNPAKTENLDDRMKNEVRLKLSVRHNQINKRIKELELKREILEKQVKAIEGKEEYLQVLESFKYQLTTISNMLATLETKKREKEESYYFERRGAYFYIEGDPIPKDFYELFTEMDSIQLENIIVRAQTKDPRNILDLEKRIVIIQKFIIFALIGLAVLVVLTFKNGNVLDQLATKAGVTFQL